MSIHDLGSPSSQRCHTLDTTIGFRSLHQQLVPVKEHPSCRRSRHSRRHGCLHGCHSDWFELQWRLKEHVHSKTALVTIHLVPNHLRQLPCETNRRNSAAPIYQLTLVLAQRTVDQNAKAGAKWCRDIFTWLCVMAQMAVCEWKTCVGRLGQRHVVEHLRSPRMKMDVLQVESSHCIILYIHVYIQYQPISYNMQRATAYFASKAKRIGRSPLRWCLLLSSKLQRDILRHQHTPPETPPVIWLIWGILE